MMFIFICKTASEYLTIATLDKIKDNYAESPYKCE